MTLVVGEGPVEQTERAAEDRAIRFLLDGLGVQSIRELYRLVNSGRMIEKALDEAMEKVRTDVATYGGWVIEPQPKGAVDG